MTLSSHDRTQLVVCIAHYEYPCASCPMLTCRMLTETHTETHMSFVMTPKASDGDAHGLVFTRLQVLCVRAP